MIYYVILEYFLRDNIFLEIIYIVDNIEITLKIVKTTYLLLVTKGIVTFFIT